MKKQFKVGDEVVVYKPEVNEYPFWTEEMRDYNGNLITIEQCDGQIIRSGGHAFHSKWCEPYDDDSSTECCYEKLSFTSFLRGFGISLLLVIGGFALIFIWGLPYFIIEWLNIPCSDACLCTISSIWILILVCSIMSLATSGEDYDDPWDGVCDD